MPRSHRSETWASGRIKASGYQATGLWAMPAASSAAAMSSAVALSVLARSVTGRGRGAEALDHELGIGGRIGAGDRVDHKAWQVGSAGKGGKLVGKLGGGKLPELELGLDLLFLLTTTRLGHPSFLPIPN